jgi:probable addiction module antidote protein
MNKASRPYKPELLKALQDPIEAAEYLNAALEENSNDLFLLALRNVAEAHGMKKLAVASQLNRESMYRMLSEQGNPQLSSLTVILKQLGLKLAVEVEEPVAA